MRRHKTILKVLLINNVGEGGGVFSLTEKAKIMLTLLAQLSPILFSSFSKIHNLPIDAKLDISKQIHWLNIGIFPHKKKNTIFHS